jgi:hypothetical protein
MMVYFYEMWTNVSITATGFEGARGRKNRVQGFEGPRCQVQKSKVQKSRSAEEQKGFKDSRIRGFRGSSEMLQIQRIQGGEDQEN